MFAMPPKRDLMPAQAAAAASIVSMTALVVYKCRFVIHENANTRRESDGVAGAVKAAAVVVLMACNGKINQALTHISRPHEHSVFIIA